MTMAHFLIHDFLLWQEFTVPDIRNEPCSTGCCSIILTSSFKNMRAVSRESTGSYVPSSRRWLSTIWTVATPAAGLPASDVRTVVRSGSFISHVAAADFAPPAIRRDGRNGESG